jgi:hypothetical protein
MESAAVRHVISSRRPLVDLPDDLSNQGMRKRILEKSGMFNSTTPTSYAHMNINYIKLDRLPAFERWGEARTAREGEFFTTTGEVLIPRVDFRIKCERSGRAGLVDAQWTFPLRYAEIVERWQTTHRETIPLGETREIRRAHVRMARARRRLAMGAPRGVGYRDQRRVRESRLEELNEKHKDTRRRLGV